MERTPGQTEPEDDRDDLSRDRCCVCGAEIEAGDLEDTNGWRWFSDGRGGLKSVCPTCPLPASATAAGDEDAGSRAPRPASALW